jgi:hypothetical protein
VGRPASLGNRPSPAARRQCLAYGASAVDMTGATQLSGNSAQSVRMPRPPSPPSWCPVALRWQPPRDHPRSCRDWMEACWRRAHHLFPIESRLERGEMRVVPSDADDFGCNQRVPDEVLRRLQCGTPQTHERPLIEPGCLLTTRYPRSCCASLHALRATEAQEVTSRNSQVRIVTVALTPQLIDGQPQSNRSASRRVQQCRKRARRLCQNGLASRFEYFFGPLDPRRLPREQGIE